MICPTCEIEIEPLVWVPVWVADSQDCIPSNDAPKVFVDSPPSDFSQAAPNPVDELTNLKDDWDGQGAPAPKQIAIDAAKRLLASDDVFGLEPVTVLPSAVGGVGVTYTSGTREVFVEARNNGRIYSIRSELGGQPHFSKVDPSNVNEFFGTVTNYLYDEPLATALETHFCEATD